jgi:murein DD-endopeptidase MepM/ murein hydrolase activator NlpD
VTPFAALPLAQLVVTSPYGPRGPVRLPDGAVKPAGFHHGIDFRAAVGTPTFAVGDGVVESVERGAAGLIVRLRLDAGERVSYVHLDDTRLRNGVRVRAGEQIATTGDSGGVAPHLHLEVRAAGASHGTDPSPYLVKPTTPAGSGGGAGVVVLGLLALVAAS